MKSIHYLSLAPVCLPLLALLTLLGGCREEEETLAPEKREIYLAASLSAVQETRVPYENTLPTRDNPLMAAVWASTDPTAFPHVDGKNGADGTNVVSLHSKAHFRSHEKQLLGDAIYPQNKAPVYFVAMHPQEGWSADATDTHVRYTFNGKEDLLFAPMASGTYTDSEADELKRIVPLHFTHLLTWLRIELLAESEAVRDAWGELKRISIRSANQVEIDLVTTPYTPTACVAFSGAADLPLYQLDATGRSTDQLFPGTSLQLPCIPLGEEVTEENLDAKISQYAKPLAYVLCAPVEATGTESTDDGETTTTEYVLTLETANRTGVEVRVDLMETAGQYFTGSTMGHRFTLLLYFKMGNVIAVKAAVADWKNGGFGGGDVMADES